ncbi:MAG: hypothetical protein U5M51_07590 [Emticicia sp.]|nr:hypothetical protein [Emticicia sp.]
MEIIEELLHSGEERALRIAKLLQLISMHQNSIEQHKKAESPNLIIEQYQELLKQRIEELQVIMQEVGIQIHLDTVNKAA